MWYLQITVTLQLSHTMCMYIYKSAYRMLSYSYITSRSRISLLLHETEGEARGRVLITMISYDCLWYNCFMSYCFDYKQIIRFLSILLLLLKINALKVFIDLLDGLEIQKKTTNFDDLLDGIDIKVLYRIDLHF